MNIDYLKIEITPRQFGDRTYRELQVTIKVDGKEWHYRKYLPEDDVTSWLDRYIGYAKEEIIRAIKAEEINRNSYVPDVLETLESEDATDGGDTQ